MPNQQRSINNTSSKKSDSGLSSQLLVESQTINAHHIHQRHKTHPDDIIIEIENQTESEEQQIKKQTELMQKQLLLQEQAKKANNKVVVGTGFSFDITEFFKFEKKKKLDSKQNDLFAELSGSVLAWLILLYSVINSSIIPGWIMNIKATKLLRIAWRFLLQSLIVIPFVLYEYRISSEQTKQQYQLKHIFNPTHLKKVYLSSISTSIWFTCVLTVFEWTYISHGLVLGALSNFFLSIHRRLTKSSHEVEPGGQVLVVLGIILVIYDSITLVPQQTQPYKYEVINPFYLRRNWYQRVTADLIALCVSFTQSKIARYTADMKGHYPPNLSILLVNIFIFINMVFSTYFFNGLTFDYDQKFGLFSIFSQQHFASFLYMSILLNTGLFISFVMISKLFPDPIFPALAMTLDPMLATFFVQVFGVQFMPRPISFIGYLLILPGVIVILIGQCLNQRKKQDDNNLNEKTKQLMNELRALKRQKNIEKKKKKLKQVKQMRKSIIEQQKLSRNEKDSNNNKISIKQLKQSQSQRQLYQKSEKLMQNSKFKQNFQDKRKKSLQLIQIKSK